MPKSPSSKAQKAPGAPGAPKAKGAVRAKSGCYTCRIRRKKCDEQPNEQGHCQTCVRLRLECLGFGNKRPEWLRETKNVVDLREKIKTFLASQGMIKGHSGSGPRNAEQEPQILRLADEPNYDVHQHQQHPPPPPHLTLSNDPNRQLLPPFSNMSAIRGTWTLPPHPPPLPYHVGPQPPPPHDMRPQTPGSQYFTSPGSHETLLPQYNQPLSSSNSLVQSPFASFPSKEPNLYASTEPWRSSSFGKLYHSPTIYSDDGETLYDDQQLDPALFNDSTNANSGMLVSYARDYPHAYLNPNPAIDHLVNHYMNAVVNIQYLLANKSSTASMIFETIQDNRVARDAVRLLASVHQHKHQTQRAEDRALMRVEHPATGLYEGLREQLFGDGGSSSPSQMVEAFARRGYSTEDAMAALLVISSLLFDGGMGDWWVWLHVAYTYVDNLLVQYPNHADALSYITDDKVSFIIKTTLWFDVIASVTIQKPPHYLELIEEVFSPNGARIDGHLSVNMLDVMGCDNNTFWAMARTSELACWKSGKIQGGALSVFELVQKGTEIEQALTHTSLSMQSGDDVDDEESCRLATAAIFRSSTLAWLHSIISGDRPHVPEVARAVQDTINRLKNIPSNTAREQRLERSIVRSTVFSIFICGVFTSKRNDRDMLIKHLEKQSSDHVGNCTAIKMLLKGIWDRYEREGGKSATVKWREPLKTSGILLV